LWWVGGCGGEADLCIDLAVDGVWDVMT